ncbi:MAG: PIN domain-containing protein [Clostridia bacterium]
MGGYVMTQSDTKIFIDTNIFLGLYNSNDAGTVEAFIHSLLIHRNLLITTGQAYDEYLRNRTRIINEFKNNFIASKIKEQTSSFVRSIGEYRKYSKCLRELQEQHKLIVDKIDQIISDPEKDYIYKGFIRIWKKNNTLQITDRHIAFASRRKILGNPPGGDKYSSGDEVNWEALVDSLHCNLIIVSKDRTFMQNQEFLKNEYKKRTGCLLEICETVSGAFSRLEIAMAPDAVAAEDDVRWLDIIIQAFRQIGGRGSLHEIYEECLDLVVLFYPNKEMRNNTIDSTIRRTIYQHSSDVDAYLGKEDLFHKVASGVWELRKEGAVFP